MINKIRATSNFEAPRPHRTAQSNWGRAPPWPPIHVLATTDVGPERRSPPTRTPNHLSLYIHQSGCRYLSIGPNLWVPFCHGESELVFPCLVSREKTQEPPPLHRTVGWMPRSCIRRPGKEDHRWAGPSPAPRTPSYSCRRVP